MNDYYITLLFLGLLFLAAAALPEWMKSLPMSFPAVCIGIGALVGWLWTSMPTIDPVEHQNIAEHLSEIAVIISLTAVGLQIDRHVGRKAWRSTWRLLGITMPLCIAALAFGGAWLLSLSAAGAILLGAVVAPTDPVLASDVQVGPPGRGEDSEAEPRFALTSEAGLNDGLAFPFVNLAIVVAATGWGAEGLAEWVGVDVVWKILAGLLVGLGAGRGLAIVVFRYCPPNVVSDGFLAIALTFVTYGATELIHGYGFIAVFVGALAFRRAEKGHEAHRNLHRFAEQTDRLLMAVILVLFGAAIADGLFDPLSWRSVAVGLAFLLVVRPLAGWVGLAGMGLRFGERAAISMFGIRGIGTFYYLAHGLGASDIGETEARALWAAAGFIVLISVLGHGATAPFVMRRVD